MVMDPHADYRILRVARHGVKGKGAKEDALTNESVQRMHSAARKDLEDLTQGDITPEQISIRYSGRIRTLETSLARASALIPLKSGKRPESGSELLKDPNLRQIETYKDEALNYREKGMMHDKVYLDKSKGVSAIFNHWVQNPYSEVHKDDKHGTAEIEPFVSLSSKLRYSLRTDIENLLNKDKKISFVTTHSGIVESLMSIIVESGGKAIESIEDIGGEVEMEGYGDIIFKRNYNVSDKAKLWEKYNAVFVRNGKTYTVNLQRLLSADYIPSFLEDGPPGSRTKTIPRQAGEDASYEAKMINEYNEKMDADSVVSKDFTDRQSSSRYGGRRQRGYEPPRGRSRPSREFSPPPAKG